MSEESRNMCSVCDVGRSLKGSEGILWDDYPPGFTGSFGVRELSRQFLWEISVVGLISGWGFFVAQLVAEKTSATGVGGSKNSTCTSRQKEAGEEETTFGIMVGCEWFCLRGHVKFSWSLSSFRSVICISCQCIMHDICHVKKGKIWYTWRVNLGWNLSKRRDFYISAQEKRHVYQ